MKLKKPKFWDYKKPNIIAYFLLPFTLPVIFNNFLLRFKKNNKNIQKIKDLGSKILNSTLNEINFYMNK
jgi:tetraacyldisaccharide 4'-kinase